MNTISRRILLLAAAPLTLSAQAREPGGGERPHAVVEEVVVTATRRTESLLNVPLSISVVTAEDIEMRRLVSSEDYLRGMPGVNQVGSSGGYAGQAIVIRGIETTTGAQNNYMGSTVGTYFGETPTSASAGQLGSSVDIKLIDIERVEVLKGPQGTSFGSASMGGTVRVIPVAPVLDVAEAKVGAGYSVTSGTGGKNYSFQAVGNMPLVDEKLALRGVAYSITESGFYRNRAGSDPTFQAAIAPYRASSFATDEDDVGAYYAAGGRISALFQATDVLRLTLSYLNQETETSGFPLQNIGTYEQAIMRVAPQHRRHGYPGPALDTHIEIANAVIEYDLSWADLLATYSYLDGGAKLALVYSIFYPLALGAQPISYNPNLTNQQDTAEIRLVTDLEGPWNFVVGLYADDQHDDYFTSEFVWVGDVATIPYATQNLGFFRSTRELSQEAAFGEVKWEFLPKFTLTGGVRAFQYERIDGLNTAGPLVGTRNERPAADDDGTTFRADVSYKPSDDALVHMGWSQGFRLGRSQSVPLDPSCQYPTEIHSDSVDNFEIGAKVALFERRVTVDAAVFHMKWDDIPVNLRPAPLCNFIANAGAALSDGVELQVSFQPTDSLRLDLGGSWTDARLDEDVPAQGLRAGTELPSPKISANLGVQQGFAIGSHPASIRGDMLYVGRFFGNVSQTPNTESGDYFKLNLSGRVTINNVNFDLYVHNVTDEDAYTSRSHYSFVGNQYGYRLRPRTIGLQLNYDF